MCVCVCAFVRAHARERERESGIETVREREAEIVCQTLSSFFTRKKFQNFP